MKIGIASHGCFPRSIGGMERHTFNLAKHLADAGVQVVALLPASQRHEAFPFPVEYFPWPKRAFWLWENYDFSRHVADYVRRSDLDVVLSQGFALWAGAERMPLPWVFHPHGLEMFGPPQGMREKLISGVFRRLVRHHAARADRIVSLGGKLTDILVEHAGAPRGKIVTIPNAVDPTEFGQMAFKKVRGKMLFVGRLAFNKGLDLLAKALKLIPNESFELKIIGQGPLQVDVEKLVREDPRVKASFDTHATLLRAEYANAEALVFCSRFEGMPTVVLEAMASRCAVLATDIGAVETMVDARSGILMRPSAESIAESIQVYLSKPFEQRQAMGLAGRGRVEALFSWGSVVKEYVRMFESLVAERASHAR